jgi:hypothetical protein
LYIPSQSLAKACLLQHYFDIACICHLGHPDSVANCRIQERILLLCKVIHVHSNGHFQGLISAVVNVQGAGDGDGDGDGDSSGGGCGGSDNGFSAVAFSLQQLLDHSL